MPIVSLVTVAAYREPHAAQIARATLEAEEIPAFVSQENLVGLDWMLSSALGGVKVQVPAEFAARAAAILGEDRSADLNGTPEASLPLASGDACPRCGSFSIRPASEERRSKALSLLLNIPFAYHRDHWRCEACGADWRIPNRNYAPLRVLGYFIAFVLYLLEGLLNLVLSAVRGGERIALLGPDRQKCWACGETCARGTPQCPRCRTFLPSPDAYDELVDDGVVYDAACDACHLPYRRADYRAGEEWRCSWCKSPLVR